MICNKYCFGRSKERRTHDVVFNIILVLIIFQLVVTSAKTLAGEMPEHGGTKLYSWELSDEYRAHLFEGVRSLKYGDSIAQVRENLGVPTRESDNFDKSGKFIEHEFTYAIKRVHPEGGNAQDQEISLNFDQHGRLIRIVYNAMSPLNGDVIFSGAEPQTGTKFFITKPPLKKKSE